MLYQSVVAADVDENILNEVGAAAGYNNDPVAAIIEGVLSGTIGNTSTDPLTGAATIIDPNFEEDAFVVQSDESTTYGSFSIDSDGNWTYTVDVADATVASLPVGDSVIGRSG